MRTPAGHDGIPVFLTVLTALRTGQGPVMLEEVEMPPGEFLDIMAPAFLAALGTGIPGATVGGNAEMGKGCRST